MRREHYKITFYLCIIYKISSPKIKFGDKEVDKKTFYSSKEATLLDSVDLSIELFQVDGSLMIQHVNIFVEI